LPPALSAKQLAGGRTQVLNVRRIRRIDRHPAEIHDDSAPESVSDTENWLHWNGDLDNPNESEDDCDADNELDVELENCFEDPECPGQRDVCTHLRQPHSTPGFAKLSPLWGGSGVLLWVHDFPSSVSACFCKCISSF